MVDQNFRVQEEELGQFAGEKSLVKLSDGSGYYMTMSVFHGLHCIQRLHHYIYHDHYYPNISEAEDFALKAHTGKTSVESSMVAGGRLLIRLYRSLPRLAAPICAVQRRHDPRPNPLGSRVSGNPSFLDNTNLTLLHELTLTSRLDLYSSAGPVSRDWGKRTCVAWDPIADFVRERSFDPFEPGLLRHPTFG